MRKADVDVAWTECRSSRRDLLKIEALRLFGGSDLVTLPVSSRIVGLVGQNGAGKTGYLLAIQSLLSGVAPSPRVALTAIDGTFRGTNFVAQEGSRAPLDLMTSYVDVSNDVHRVLRYVRHQSNFQEILDQSGARDLPLNEIARYKYVCRNNYSKIEVSEIEVPSGDVSVDREEEVFPFFSVTRDGLSYDSASMGFGELCACYTLWKAMQASKGSVLLLDEPDSHLSPASRSALADILALVAHERKLWVVFSSHACEHLRVMDIGDICIAMPGNAGISQTLIAAGNGGAILRALGLSPSRTLLVIVEDVDSEECVRQIVNKWGGDLASVVDVQIVQGGDATVVSFIRNFPSRSRICRAVAVLDGDKKNSYLEGDDLLFLPSTEDPICAARKCLEVEAAIIWLADALGGPLQRVKSAFERVKYVDHHDFCGAMAEELSMNGVRVDTVRSAVIRAWLQSGNVDAQAEELVAQIAARQFEREQR